MKIVRKKDSDEALSFGDLEGGDVFECNGDLFVRTDLPEGKEGAAVRLHDGLAIGCLGVEPIELFPGTFFEE